MAFRNWTYVLPLLLSVAAAAAFGDSPEWFTYQGYLEVARTPFGGADGTTGQFKFAICDQDLSTNFWANDGTPAGPPAAAIDLLVVKGLFTVNLGDTAVPGMQPMSPADFPSDTNFYVRVWFNDSAGAGWSELTPAVQLPEPPLVEYVTRNGLTNILEDIYVNESGDTMTGALIINAGGLTVNGGDGRFANDVAVEGDLSVATDRKVHLGGPDSETYVTFDGENISVFKEGTPVMEFDGD